MASRKREFSELRKACKLNVGYELAGGIDQEETASVVLGSSCRTACSTQGKCSVNVLPRPGTLFTVTWPFIASMMLFARGRPRPVP
jgi:hypothetical protein